MGYTNKTSHYELPQYVANDKPSWLGDFNAAMLKIDTVMADNDATAEAANSAATGAQTQVSALSAQISTIQGQVNTAIDTATTADGKATTAQTVATQASTTAGEAKVLAETAKQTADNALPIGGGTMTGPLILSVAPTADNQAATKAYVDERATGEVEDVVFTRQNVAEQTTQQSNIILFKKQGKVYSLTCYQLRTAHTTPELGSKYAFAKVQGNILGLPDGTNFNALNLLAVKSDGTTVTPISVVYNGGYTCFCYTYSDAEMSFGGSWSFVGII